MAQSVTTVVGAAPKGRRWLRGDSVCCGGRSLFGQAGARDVLAQVPADDLLLSVGSFADDVAIVQ